MPNTVLTRLPRFRRHRRGLPMIGLACGGHARCVLDALAGHAGAFRVVAPFDDDPAARGRRIHGIPVVGAFDVDAVREAAGPGGTAFVGVGGIGDLGPRARCFARLLDSGLVLPPIAHATAVCSPSSRLGPGAQVLAGAVLNAGARVAANAIVNAGAIVGHDAVVARHAHIAPGAVLGGGAVVGEAAHVGSGAVVLQGRSVGAGAVVGSGAVVVRDIPAGACVAGIPARGLDAGASAAADRMGADVV